VLDQGALEPERLAHDVDRVLERAQVAQVRVAVVPDQATVPDRPQQGPVGEERVDADAPERRQHVVDGPDEGLDVVGAPGVEGLHPTQGLVECERSPVRVHDRDPALTGAERDLLVEQHVLTRVDPQRDPDRAVEEVAQGAGPGDQVPTVGRHSVAMEPEGPDATVVEEHVDDDLVA
jgi:hypothetical protein